MFKKLVVALGIFTVLFIWAWWLNEINEKRYYIDQRSEKIQSLMVEEGSRFEKFRPREYIKIKR